MAVQLSSLWKQWGGEEVLREKGNANSLPIFIAVAVWSSCGNFWSITKRLKLYLFICHLVMTKEGGVVGLSYGQSWWPSPVGISKYLSALLDSCWTLTP